MLTVIAQKHRTFKTALGATRRLSVLIGLLVMAVGGGWIAAEGAAAAGEATLTLVAVGDSLTSGLGLKDADAFPAQLEKALAAAGERVRVTNAGVSGDTARDGLARIDWSVDGAANAVILEFGANDALRGIDPAVTRDALDAMLARLQARGIPVLLVGMLAPPNMGETYATAFNAIFPDLAKAHGVALYPFFLDGVATNAKLTQGDGLHPNSGGVAVIVQRILPSVLSLVREAAAR